MDRLVMQPDLGQITDVSLRSLWIDIPPVCHLNCPYCFSNAKNNATCDGRWMKWEHYEQNILRPFATESSGEKWVGIPGAGEPFHEANISLTKQIIELTEQLKITGLTIFTSGDKIDNPLAKYLYEKKHVRVMVKWNSNNAEIQNRLVNDKTQKYFAARQEAWERLTNLFARERQRLGIVTSILVDNWQEVPALLEFARKQGVAFDCDTLLPKGRGLHCAQRPLPSMVRDAVGKMQSIDKARRIIWQAAGAYIGCSCDRYRHHLYIAHDGEVYPCLGTCILSLGNVKERDIVSLWKSPERQALANRTLTGACAACVRSARGDCSSCIGRNRSPSTTKEQLKAGWISTVPCELFMPQFSIALHAATIRMRDVLASSLTVDEYLGNSLERLWDPTFSPPDAPRSKEEGEFVSQFCHVQNPRNIPGEMVRTHHDQWIRDTCLSKLLSDESPVAILASDHSNQTEFRVAFSEEGFPIPLSLAPNKWQATTLTLAGILPSHVIDWMVRFVPSLDLKNARIAVSFVLKRIVEERGSGVPNLLSDWFIEPITRSASHQECQQTGTVIGQNRNEQDTVGFDLIQRKTGYRLNLATCWVKKFLTLRDVPIDWSSLFDPKTGGIQFPGGHRATYESNVATILPTLLAPLTDLVLESHHERTRPAWILWLFYDPCRNVYFRRLMDCRQSPSDPQDVAALHMLYLWPERSADVEVRLQKEYGTKSVDWFDCNVLNLSDVLRDPLVDYELLTAEAQGQAPERALLGERFPIQTVIQALEERSKSLLVAARSPEITEEERDVLTACPLPQTSLERLAHTPIYHKMADCFGRMNQCLIQPSDPQMAAHTISDLYDMLPENLRKKIRESIGVSGDVSNEHKQRALNYFIFLGALKLLGAKNYYVGQTLTHNLISAMPHTAGAETWRMPPCGFIAAGEHVFEDEFIADLRLVYSAVMAPIVEQYAKWTSGYEVERAKVVRSFPCLQRVPKHYIRQLEDRPIRPDTSWLSQTTADVVSLEDTKACKEDLEWLRRLPKADLHVHIGPALSPDLLYDLSALSLSRWKPNGQKDMVGKLVNKVTRIVESALTKIDEKLLKNKDLSGGDVQRENWFKEDLIHAAWEELADDSIHDVNSALKILSSDGIPTDQCACILNMILGHLVRPTWDLWEDAIETRLKRLKDFAKYLNEVTDSVQQEPELTDTGILLRARKIVHKAYLNPFEQAITKRFERYCGSHDQILQGIRNSLNQLGLATSPFSRRSWKPEWGDPLSNVLSMAPKMDGSAKGLERYIGSSSLTGSSVLQSHETLALAMMETAIHASKTDAVRYMEVKLSPVGIMGQVARTELVISTALLALSYVSDRAVATLLRTGDILGTNLGNDEWPYVLVNLVIAGKRHDNRSALKSAIQNAVDARDKYLNAQVTPRDNKTVDARRDSTPVRHSDLLSVVHDIFGREDVDLIVPRVVGVDLVGRERGIRHSELRETMMEAFEKCILLTIHAGEEEDERSVWDAIFSLHAQRIGHGLRMSGSMNLTSLIRDRRIPVELCPLSNHFTNGFLYTTGPDYVYKAYREKQMTLVIATDDPWISHRLRTSDERRPYPLSEEYQALPLLFAAVVKKKGDDGVEKEVRVPGKVSKLEIMRLLYNSFDNAFLAAPDRDALIGLADLHAFLAISKHDLQYQVNERA